MTLRRRDEPLVTIAEFATSFEASLARGALEAIGIRAVVPGERLGVSVANHAALVRNRGGAPHNSVQVFASDRDRALVELKRLQIRIVEPPDVDG